MLKPVCQALSLSALLLTGALTAAADEPIKPVFKMETTALDDDNCAVYSGDYGAPEATMEVKSNCTGPDGWTVKLTEYAKHQAIGFQYKDTAATEDMKVLWFGQRGKFADPEWVYKDGKLISVILQYIENGEMSGQAFNRYVVALKHGSTPSACLIARVEEMKIRGGPAAAAYIAKTFPERFDCAASEPLEFTSENSQGGYYSAVRKAAKEAGLLTDD